MTNPNLFFSTPVWASKIDNYKETNEDIYGYIKMLQSADNSGIIKSNVKGWHSRDFDLKSESPKKFINLISSEINNVINDMNWDINNQTINYKLLEAKAERNAKLSDSDIYIIEDFPTTKKTEWKTYRQALRDMDFSDLDNLTWPTKPE